MIEPAGAGGRLFLALWPGARLRAGIVRASEAALQAAGGRPVLPVDYHLTLAFLGGVSPAQRAGLVALTAGLAPPRCRLVLDQFGYFRGPAVFWLGPAAVPPVLAGFVTRLWATLAGLGLAAEELPFRPHVTLARKVSDPPAIAPPDPAPVWPVRGLVLAESVAPAGRPGRYRIIARSPG